MGNNGNKGNNKDIDANDNTKGNPRHMYVDCGMGLLRFSIKAIHTHKHSHMHTQATHSHTHTFIYAHTFIYIATFMKFAWQNVAQFVKLGSETHTPHTLPQTHTSIHTHTHTYTVIETDNLPHFVKLISYIRPIYGFNIM